MLLTHNDIINNTQRKNMPRNHNISHKDAVLLLIRKTKKAKKCKCNLKDIYFT